MAADIGAVWGSPTSGTLHGTTFTAATDSGPLSIANLNLRGSNYSDALLSIAENVFVYRQNANLTFNFASPVRGLRLHLVLWRLGNHTFNRAFDIKSGINFTKSGNQITVTQDFADGIIEFTEDVSTLTIGGFSPSISDLALQFSVSDVVLPTVSTSPPTISIP